MFLFVYIKDLKMDIRRKSIFTGKFSKAKHCNIDLIWIN